MPSPAKEWKNRIPNLRASRWKITTFSNARIAWRSVERFLPALSNKANSEVRFELFLASWGLCVLEFIELEGSKAPRRPEWQCINACEIELPQVMQLLVFSSYCSL